MDYLLAKEYPTFYGNPQVHDRVHRGLLLLHTLIQTKEVNILFLENAFQRYFPSTANPSKWSLPLRFYYRISCMLCSQIPCMLHAALISFFFI